MIQENFLTRREKERLVHRQLILDIALKLFSELGYHRVSMHKIAQRAEFAIGTLYNFFPNKEELFRAIIKEFAERTNSAFITALEVEGNEVEKIRNYIRVIGEILMENEAILKLHIGRTHDGAGMDLTAGLNEEVQILYEKVLQKLADVIAAGIKAGHFKPLLAPYYLAVSLNSTIGAFLLLWLRAPQQHPFLENAVTIVDLFLSNIKTESGTPLLESNV